jgi:hypothetical protein
MLAGSTSAADTTTVRPHRHHTIAGLRRDRPSVPRGTRVEIGDHRVVGQTRRSRNSGAEPAPIAQVPEDTTPATHRADSEHCSFAALVVSVVTAASTNLAFRLAERTRLRDDKPVTTGRYHGADGALRRRVGIPSATVPSATTRSGAGRPTATPTPHGRPSATGLGTWPGSPGRTGCRARPRQREHHCPDRDRWNRLVGHSCTRAETRAMTVSGWGKAVGRGRTCQRDSPRSSWAARAASCLCGSRTPVPLPLATTWRIRELLAFTGDRHG